MLLLSLIVKIFFRSCFFIPGLHCGVQQQQAACRQPRLVAAPPGRGRACGDVLVLTPLPAASRFFRPREISRVCFPRELVAAAAAVHSGIQSLKPHN